MAKVATTKTVDTRNEVFLSSFISLSVDQSQVDSIMNLEINPNAQGQLTGQPRIPCTVANDSCLSSPRDLLCGDKRTHGVCRFFADASSRVANAREGCRGPCHHCWRAKPGSRNYDIVGGLDFMATFAALGGVSLPDKDLEGKPMVFDSYDMTPLHG